MTGLGILPEKNDTLIVSLIDYLSVPGKKELDKFIEKLEALLKTKFRDCIKLNSEIKNDDKDKYPTITNQKF